MSLFSGISGFFSDAVSTIGNTLGGIFNTGSGLPSRWEAAPARERHSFIRPAASTRTEWRPGYEFGVGLRENVIEPLAGQFLERYLPSPNPGCLFGGAGCGTFPRPPSRTDQVIYGAPRGVGVARPGSGPDSANVQMAGLGMAGALGRIGQVSGRYVREGVRELWDDLPRWAQWGIESAGAIGAHEGLEAIFGETPAAPTARQIPQTTTMGVPEIMATNLPGGAAIGQSMIGQPYGGLIFKQGMRYGHIVPIPRSTLQIPYNGRILTYKNMGSPILYTGDLSAKKRVERAARRAKRGG